MSKSTTHVLKNNEVELEGQFHLDAAQARISKPQQKGPALTAPQVRILENNHDYAVIDIICSCGTEMSIRCDYADGQAGKPSET